MFYSGHIEMDRFIITGLSPSLTGALRDITITGQELHRYDHDVYGLQMILYDNENQPSGIYQLRDHLEHGELTDVMRTQIVINSLQEFAYGKDLNTIKQYMDNLYADQTPTFIVYVLALNKMGEEAQSVSTRIMDIIQEQVDVYRNTKKGEGVSRKPIKITGTRILQPKIYIYGRTDKIEI